MSKMFYQEMQPHEFDAALQKAPVAFLPLGTLEYHGPHMPIGNDALKAEAILKRVCAQTGGIMVPTFYWGIGGGHKGYPTTIIIRDDLLGAMLDEILEGLYRNQFKVFVVLTGHYPGEQIQAVKEAAARLLSRHPEVHIWGLPEHEAFPGEFRGDHAAKWETSILMHLRPELVDMDQIKDAALPSAPDATRSLDEMNAPGPLHGMLGENPARTASPQLGQETVDVIVANLVRWVEKALKEI